MAPIIIAFKTACLPPKIFTTRLLIQVITFAIAVTRTSMIGINALIRLISSNKLTADSIQNYAKPVLKERLDILYGMSADDKDGYKQIINNLPYMTRKADEIYDLVFVDMPKSLSKKSIMDTVADAEIVVCVVNQDAVKLSDFFTTLSTNEILKYKTKCFIYGIIL